MSRKKQKFSKVLELFFNFENVRIVSIHLSLSKQNEISVLLKRSQDYIKSEATESKIEDVIMEYDPLIISNTKLSKQKNSTTLELVRYTQLTTLVDSILTIYKIKGEKRIELTINSIMKLLIDNSNVINENLINDIYPFTTEYSEDDFLFRLNIYKGEQEKLQVQLQMSEARASHAQE